MAKLKFSGVLSVILSFALLLAACSNNVNIDNNSSSSINPETQLSDTAVTTVLDLQQDDYYFDWKSKSYTDFDISTQEVSITKSGIYHITGNTATSNITINVDKSVDKDTVFIILDNVSITSTDKTPINIIEAKKVTIILESGTTNKIIQNSITTEDVDFPSGAIYSKADLTFTGSGTLQLTSYYNDGIVSKDDLIITDGMYDINVVGDAIVGKDLLGIADGKFNIISGKDGLKTTNVTDLGKGSFIIQNGDFTIDALGDGIDAVNYIGISNGAFSISTGGGYTGVIKQSNNGGKGMFNQQPIQPTTQDSAENVDNTVSQKGIKAGTDLVVNGGTYNLSCYEDAFHSNGNITINSGTITIQSGDDGIHADQEIIINNGKLDIENSYEGIEAVNITINGGDISVVSSDDGINVSDRSGTLTVTKGTIFIKASGDGIDSNGNIVMTGGYITIDTTNIKTPETSIDFDGEFSGSGYTIIDQNSNEIDPKAANTMGGGGGMKGDRVPTGEMPQEGQMPNKEFNATQHPDRGSPPVQN